MAERGTVLPSSAPGPLCSSVLTDRQNLINSRSIVKHFAPAACGLESLQETQCLSGKQAKRFFLRLRATRLSTPALAVYMRRKVIQSGLMPFASHDASFADFLAVASIASMRSFITFRM